MIPSPIRTTVTAFVSVLVLTAAATAAEARVTGSFERTLQVTGEVDLDVRTGSGSVTVQQGPAGTVRVVGRITASDSWRFRGPSAQERVRAIENDPPIRQNGNSIRIGDLDDRRLFENVSISYEVTVPAATRLRSSTGSGRQTIDGVDGPIRVGTGSGSVRIGRVGGPAEISTGSGGIDIESLGGRLDARTGSGSISVGALAGPANLRTGSGGISVAQTAAGDIEASTGSGRITIDGVRGAVSARAASGNITVQGEPLGQWNLSTSSGRVSVRLPAEAAFDLDARTASGSIQTAHPVTVVGTINRRQVKGTVRGGGPTIYVRAASGSIDVQ
jgi:hypothetical protein